MALPIRWDQGSQYPMIYPQNSKQSSEALWNHASYAVHKKWQNRPYDLAAKVT